MARYVNAVFAISATVISACCYACDGMLVGWLDETSFGSVVTNRIYIVSPAAAAAAVAASGLICGARDDKHINSVPRCIVSMSTRSTLEKQKVHHQVD